MREAFKIAIRLHIMKRSLWVAAVVGTVLNMINQGDALFAVSSLDMTKFALTYLVPYCVATYGSVAALRTIEAKSG